MSTTVWRAGTQANADDGSFGPRDTGARVAALADGGYVVAWVDQSASRAYLRRFDALGEPEGDAIQVAGPDAWNGVDVATAGAGFQLVLTGRNGAGDPLVVRQRYAADGTLEAVLDAGGFGATVSTPTLAKEGAGYFFALDALAPDADVLGAVGGGAARRVAQQSDAQTAPDAARLPGGRVAVVFQDEFSGTDEDVFFALYDPSGATAVERREVASGSLGQTQPAVAALVGTQFTEVFVVAYVDAFAGDGSGAGIAYRPFDRQGRSLGDARIANATTAGDQRSPEVIGLRDGGFAILWEDGAAPGLLRGRRFNSQFDPVGGDFEVAAGTRLSDPQVDVLADGRLVVVYEENRIGDLDVFAAIIDPRDDEIFGTGGANVIAARVQGGTVFAGGGADTVIGGAGEDTVQGGAGRDVLTGGAGRDLLWGQGGADELFGEDGRDTLAGGAGDDRLLGGGGGDSLSGGGGDDTLLGNGWRDVLEGGGGDDVLRGDRGSDRLVGGRGNDELDGGLGRDTLLGGQGADTLSGFFGDDVLEGGGGDDLLLGGNGRDTLVGGGGADVFAFASGHGFDVVVGLQRRLDRIDLTRTSDRSFDDLTVRQRGDDAIVVYDGGRIRLEGVAAEEVTARLFIFDDLAAL